jgi:hypothetical protein
MRHYAYSRFLERRFILSRFFFMLEQGDSLTTIVLSAEGRKVQHYDPTSYLGTLFSFVLLPLLEQGDSLATSFVSWRGNCNATLRRFTSVVLGRYFGLHSKSVFRW